MDEKPYKAPQVEPEDRPAIPSRFMDRVWLVIVALLVYVVIAVFAVVLSEPPR